MTILRQDRLTRALIDEWAKTDPTIKACLMAHIRGDLTYEQALIAMVHYLATRNGELVNSAMKHHLLSAPPIVLQVPDKETLEKVLAALRESKPI